MSSPWSAWSRSYIRTYGLETSAVGGGGVSLTGKKLNPVVAARGVPKSKGDV